MNCKLYRDLLSLYVGGDLERDEEIAVRSHVGVCSDCAREVEEYRSAMTALLAAKPDEPAPSLWEGVAAAIAPGKPEAKPSNLVTFPGLAWISCAAALFMGLAVGLVVQAMMTRTPPPAEKTPSAEISHHTTAPNGPEPKIIGTGGPSENPPAGGLINDFITFLTGPGADASPKKRKTGGRDILNPEGSYHLQPVEIVPPGPRRVRF